MQDDVLWIALLNHRAISQNSDAVAQSERLVQVVGDEYDRLVQLFLQAEENVLHVGANQRVERRKRFVHQQGFRVGGQRPRQADTLLHTARKLCRIMVLESRQADAIQPFPALLLGLFEGCSLNHETVRRVFRYGLVHMQPEFLKYHRNLVTPKFNQFLLGHGQDILAIDHDAAGGGFDQPIDVAYQGGLYPSRTAP